MCRETEDTAGQNNAHSYRPCNTGARRGGKPREKTYKTPAGGAEHSPPDPRRAVSSAGATPVRTALHAPGRRPLADAVTRKTSKRAPEWEGRLTPCRVTGDVTVHVGNVRGGSCLKAAGTKLAVSLKAKSTQKNQSHFYVLAKVTGNGGKNSFPRARTIMKYLGVN